jgi:hypothetical protein
MWMKGEQCKKRPHAAWDCPVMQADGHPGNILVGKGANIGEFVNKCGREGAGSQRMQKRGKDGRMQGCRRAATAASTTYLVLTLVSSACPVCIADSFPATQS